MASLRILGQEVAHELGRRRLVLRGLRHDDVLAAHYRHASARTRGYLRRGHLEVRVLRSEDRVHPRTVEDRGVLVCRQAVARREATRVAQDDVGHVARLVHVDEVLDSLDRCRAIEVPRRLGHAFVGDCASCTPDPRQHVPATSAVVGKREGARLLERRGRRHQLVHGRWHRDARLLEERGVIEENPGVRVERQAVVRSLPQVRRERSGVYLGGVGLEVGHRGAEGLRARRGSRVRAPSRCPHGRGRAAASRPR